MRDITRNFSVLVLVAAGIALPGSVRAQGFLGASAANVAVVETVAPGSLAASAGIKPGDVILDVDGRQVRSAEELVNVLRSLRPAKRVLITVSRAGAKLLLTAYPKVPDSAPAFQPSAAPASAPSVSEAGAPPLGDYGCTHRWLRGTVFSGEWQLDMKGGFKLMPGGQYRYLEGGEVGRYSYDPATHKLHFKGGYFGNTDAVGEFIPRDKTSQIDIVFPTKSPTRWNCSQQR